MSRDKKLQFAADWAVLLNDGLRDPLVLALFVTEYDARNFLAIVKKVYGSDVVSIHPCGDLVTLSRIGNNSGYNDERVRGRRKIK